MNSAIKIFFFSFLLFFSCKSTTEDSIASLLTNNGNGKYWDLIYQTDINGNIQNVLKVKDSTAKECIYFFGKHGIEYYYNIDSIRIVHMNEVASDLRYDGNFIIKSDTIGFWGKKYLIHMSDTTSIELHDITFNGKAIRKFRPSKNQNKYVCLKRDCLE